MLRTISHRRVGGAVTGPANTSSVDCESDQRGSAGQVRDLRKCHRQDHCRKGTPSAWHENVLLAADCITHDAAAQAGTGIEAPEHLSVFSIERADSPERIPVEDEPAAGRQ